jgi:hypothetical protein
MHTNSPFFASRLITRILPVALLLVLLPAMVLAQNTSSKPITEKGLTDALKLGGLDESELIGAIKMRGVDFQLSVESEKSLRAAGATDGEIAVVRANYRGAAAAPVQPALQPVSQPVETQAATPTPASSGVYFKANSGWKPLPVESVTWEGAGGMSGLLRKASVGLLQMTGTVAGSHSGSTVRSPAQFLLRLGPGKSAENYLLVHLHDKHDNREFKCGGEKSSDGVNFQASKIDENSYQVSFTAGSGEYAFVLRSGIPKDKNSPSSSPAFTFRIPD